MTHDSWWLRAQGGRGSRPGEGPAATRTNPRRAAGFRRTRLAEDLRDWAWLVAEAVLLLLIFHLRDLVATAFLGGTP